MRVSIITNDGKNAKTCNFVPKRILLSLAPRHKANVVFFFVNEDTNMEISMNLRWSHRQKQTNEARLWRQRSGKKSVKGSFLI